LQLDSPAPSGNTKRLNANDISTWNLAEVQSAIDEIYARYGTEFPDKHVQAWADQQPLYHRIPGRTPEMAEALFTDDEKVNVEILAARRNALR
jgi:hypothetical protein